MQRDNAYKLQMVDTWQRLTSAYGNAFVSQYGDLEGQGFKDWCMVLSHLQVERIQAGTDRTIRLNQAFPPGLGEFMAICEAVDVGERPAEPTPAPKQDKPRLSIMAIEQGKQRALCGKPFKLTSAPGHLQVDWSGEDEIALDEMISGWDPNTGLRGLCELLDDHQFSSGSLNQHLGKSKGTLCGGARVDVDML